MARTDSSLNDDAFTIWINRPSPDARHMGNRGAVIKRGRDVTKVVTVTNYGDKRTGEIKKRELRFRAYAHRGEDQPDYDEKDPKSTWFCENGEIERVLAFLQSEVTRTGRYQIVDTASPAGIILDILKGADSDSQELANVLVQHGNLEQLVATLSASTRGLSIAQLAVVEKRQKLISELQTLLQDPTTTETSIQRLIGSSYWIFGGRYVGIADRRNLMPLDQHDIPLLGADGTLHIVELKGPVIPKLVRHHRNHWIVGNEINEAVGQAMNYVRAFDELGTTAAGYYRNELGTDYDMRRVFATVIIGHPDHEAEVAPNGQKANERIVQSTIRSYNAHLSRIEVRTYKDLADSARRALLFENESTLSDSQESASANLDNAQPEPQMDFQDPWADEPPF
jgi:hypothetical protein